MYETTVVSSSVMSTKIDSTINSSSTWNNQLIREPTRQVTFIGAILAFVFIFFGLIGNILLITTILSVKKLRSNIINIFIVSVRSSCFSVWMKEPSWTLEWAKTRRWLDIRLINRGKRWRKSFFHRQFTHTPRVKWEKRLIICLIKRVVDD